MNTPQPTDKKKIWITPVIEDLNINKIKQELTQQDLELLDLLTKDENAFRLFTGSTSDYRLKKELRDFNGVDIINRLRVYDYAWKNDGSREFGFVAHELQQVIPYLVTGEKDALDNEGKEQYQRVNYAKLTPILFKALQEQQEMIQLLQKEVAELSKAVSTTAQ